MFACMCVSLISLPLDGVSAPPMNVVVGHNTLLPRSELTAAAQTDARYEVRLKEKNERRKGVNTVTRRSCNLFVGRGLTLRVQRGRVCGSAHVYLFPRLFVVRTSDHVLRALLLRPPPCACLHCPLPLRLLHSLTSRPSLFRAPCALPCSLHGAALASPLHPSAAPLPPPFAPAVFSPFFFCARVGGIAAVPCP